MITKIQFDYFEDGEYTNECERNLDELIQLFAQFQFKHDPNKQLTFSVENSICMEASNGNFLKIMNYMEGVFHIWFYNTIDFELFQLYFYRPDDIVDLIKDFYNQGLLPVSKYNLSHGRVDKDYLDSLKSKTFKYSTKTRWVKFLIFSCFMELLFLIFSLFLLVESLLHGGNVILFIFSFVICCPGLIVFINHLKKSNGYHLVLSKGNDTFYYGLSDSLQSFSKNDIRSFEEVGITAVKSLLNQFYYVKITMVDGTKIIIPNLIIDEELLWIKFPRLNGITRKKNPYIYEKSLVTLN